MPGESNQIARALLALERPDVRRRFVEVLLDARDQLDSGAVNTVVVAARRMTCLYALCLGAGLREAQQGEVTSDRFLALRSREPWKGRRTILLDDTKLTGRTLDTRFRRLERCAGKGNVSTVVVLDLEAQAGNDVEIRQLRQDLHLEFAKVFGDNLVPYFTDFPITEEVQVSASALSEILTMPSWTCVDVTNRALVGSSCRSFTLLPPPKVVERLCHELRVPPSWIRVAKIRLVVRDDGDQTTFRAIPIVLTDSVPDAPLRTLANDLELGDGSADVAPEMLGLITYVASDFLVDLVRAGIEDRAGSPLAVDTTMQRIIMGEALPGKLGTVRDILPNWFADTLGGSLQEARGAIDTLQLGGEEVTHYSDYLVLGDDLVRPAFDLFASDRAAGRGEYLKVADGTSQAGENLASFSLALDVLNDLGFAVPEFSSSEGVSVRVFRRGEPEGLPSVGPLGGHLALLAETMEVVDESGTAGMRPLFRGRD